MVDSPNPADARLAIGEVAHLFGVTVGTVRSWERAGRISATRTPGGQRRFRRGDVEALLAQSAEASA